MLLIYGLLKHEVTNSQNNCIKLCSLYGMQSNSLVLKLKQQNNLLINKILKQTKLQAEASLTGSPIPFSMYQVITNMVGKPSQHVRSWKYVCVWSSLLSWY